MINYNDIEKSKLIKDALLIVDELSNSDLPNFEDEFDSDDFDYEMLQNLIKKAKMLKKNKWWKLK